ncbi:MAG: SoxR reducing system RseC family protein [Gammaproteobacteria bacterium]|nr:SoxR reducing system RseC family protein [Gammaproteobacteria bacterium]
MVSASDSAFVEQSATVVSVQETTVTLSTIRLNTCQQCAMKAGCGQRMLNQASSCQRSQVELPKPESLVLELGQEVRVAIPQSTFIRASLWVFLVPLLTMLASALIAQYWFSTEPSIAIAGVVGLALGLIIMRRRMRSLQQHSQWQPHLVVSDKESGVQTLALH